MLEWDRTCIINFWGEHVVEQFIVQKREASLLRTHAVLGKTYVLLGMTLAFSALMATLSMGLPPLNAWTSIIGAYGLLFLTHRMANSRYGIISTFAFTGFMGFTLGPILSQFVAKGAGDLIISSLLGTALLFFSASAYVLTSKKDFSFLTGTLFSMSIVLLFAMLANLFFRLPALDLAISSLFVFFSSCMIMVETSRIIHNGERNYIRATVSLYVSLYNIFVSLLRILSAFRKN